MSRVIEERIVAIVARNALHEALPCLSEDDFEDGDMRRLWGALSACGFDAMAIHVATGLGPLLASITRHSAFCPTHLPSYVRIARHCSARRKFQSMTKRLRGGNAIRRI